jgi:hypothetical protein
MPAVKIGADKRPKIVGKLAGYHNVYLRFFALKTPLVVADFPCQPNILYASNFTSIVLLVQNPTRFFCARTLFWPNGFE